MVHADLKPSNVLILRHDSGWVPKLCDFGLSGITTAQDSPRGGSLAWKASECLEAEHWRISSEARDFLHQFVTSPCIDVYAFGLIVARILRGSKETLFQHSEELIVLKLTSRDLISTHAWSALPLDVQEGPFGPMSQYILSETLKVMPPSRIGMVQLAEELLPILDDFHIR